MKWFQKKICHLTTAHNAISGRILDRECIKLFQAGYDVTLIARHKKKFQIIKGVKIISFPETNSRVFRMTVLNAYMLFKALKQKSHLYHFHDPELLLVGYILKMIGKKVVYDVHEDLPKQIYNKHYLPTILVPFISKFIEHIESYFSKSFDGLITVVPTIKNRLLKYNHNTIMYRNFPDISLIDSVKVNKQDKNKYFTIIYPGSLSKKRGVEDAINLAGLYKGRVKLILAGNWESPALEKNCKKLFGWKFTKYLGRVSQDKVFGLMKLSDLGIHLIHDIPSSRIGYPMKAFEFMACKLPFVISDIGNKRKLFKNACIYAEPGNIQDIKAKVDTVIKNKKYRARLGNIGRNRVLKLYNLDKELKTLLNFYKKILK